jgi:uncharacterized repeat protein (TIGR04076 family)
MEGVGKVKITVLKRFKPSEVFKKMPVTPKNENFDQCTMFKDRQVFVVRDMRKPEGFCDSAWHAIYGNVRLLQYGGSLPWFKEKGVAVNCCIDGLRPVIFKLERV